MLSPRIAQRQRRGDRADHGEKQRQCGENEKGRQERIRLVDGGVSCRDAEDQHRNRQRQDEHRDQHPAARQADRDRRAGGTNKGDGRRADEKVSAVAPRPAGTMLMMSPSNGEAMTSGSTLAVQCARHFISTVSASICGSDDNGEQVERAVVAVGLEQPVEAEQGRQQGADPQNRRANAREQVQVRADAKGIVATSARKKRMPVSAPPPARTPSRKSRR